MNLAPSGFTEWRRLARQLLQNDTHPSEIDWTVPECNGLSLFESPQDVEVLPRESETLKVSREFFHLAEWVALHRDPKKWGCLYSLLWKMQKGEKNILKISVDPDVSEAERRLHQVKRDVHKMHAFVRFRSVKKNGQEIFWAWFEPDHFILKVAIPFFTRRFGSMTWMISTPDGAAFWEGQSLTFYEAPLEKPVMNENGDLSVDLWKAYYASVFNPARVKVGAMKKEMPVRYWKNLPEAELIAPLLKRALVRVHEMKQGKSYGESMPRSRVTREDARNYFPPDPNHLKSLIQAASSCRGCELCDKGTQTVFSEGSSQASIVIVGEQPGDQEDLAGLPFVGPAGQLLHKILAKVGLDRKDIYFTNAVKHFNHIVIDGKKRLHQKPKIKHIRSCHPWLEAEMKIIKPQVLLCLGSTAAQSVVGLPLKIHEVRGAWRRSPFCERTLITFHPSALLRARDEQRVDMSNLFEKDLAALVDMKKNIDKDSTT